MAAALGAFVGNFMNEVLQFQTWLGRPVDFVRAHTGRANWSDYDSSIGWLGTQFAPLNKPIYWSIPMFADGNSLEDAAAGAYVDHWTSAARSILATRSSDNQIFVRIGEEFNGDWMPWAAKGQEQDFIQAFRKMVDAFRSVSGKFKFEWNVNIGGSMDPARAYPGDAYVDVVGMDFYYDTTWDPKDTLAAWNYMVQRPYGLQWLESFASAHGKPTAYSEWGIKAADAAPFITQAAAWFQSHNVLYQSYWNSNSGVPSKLSDGSIPGNTDEAAAYLKVFSQPYTSQSDIRITASHDSALTDASVTAVYRFYDTSTGDHFYTTSTAEKAQILKTLPSYQYEGVGWATPQDGANTIDVFRFYDTRTGQHFFTTDAAERDTILKTLPSYHYEGVAFEAYASAVAAGAGGVTLERFYNTQTGLHHYAANAAEAAAINQGSAGPGWVDEGRAFTVHIPTDGMLFA